MSAKRPADRLAPIAKRGWLGDAGRASQGRPRERLLKGAFSLGATFALLTLAVANTSMGPPAERRSAPKPVTKFLASDTSRRRVRTHSERRTKQSRRERLATPAPKPLPPALSVRVARTEEEVEALRPLWSLLPRRSVQTDIDHLLTFVRLSPQVLRPHVVMLERDGVPAALLVARLEHRPVVARLAPGVRLSARMRVLTVLQEGFLGRVDELADVILESLDRSLEGEDVDLVRLRMLPVGSRLHSAARARAPALTQRRFVSPMTRWSAEVPATLDEYLAARSKERRKSVRRHMRRLEQAFGPDLEVRFFRTRDELERLFADSAHVHRTTYQHRIRVGFSDDELQRGLTALAMDRGWFLGAVLYLGGQPVAFQHGHLYAGRYDATATAFDPAYADFRPGTYVLMKLIEELCADPDARRLSLGLGDAEYKQGFSDSSRSEEDVAVFSRRPRTLAVHTVQTVALAGNAVARSALGHGRRLPRLRKRWRARLTPSVPDRGPGPSSPRPF
jgi:CelD/BcsL family acetyltransferase involved in cellulose biosynthesis